MEPIPLDIHVLNELSGIEGRHLQAKSTSMFGLNSGFASGFEVFLQAFVLKRLDHRESVACCASRNKLPFFGM